MQKKALDILQTNRDRLDALAVALLEGETLTREEVRKVLGDPPKAG
jgi:ATP-dependent Zn protease